MGEAIFIDTWGWVALGHRHDDAHREIGGLFHEINGQGALIYTSDYVLDELITSLYRRADPAEVGMFLGGILKAMDTGHLLVERVTPERFAQAWELRLKYGDKPSISFTDFTTMAIMKDLGIQRILTKDRHFSQIGMGLALLP